MGDKRIEAMGRKAEEKREGYRKAARGEKSMAAHERTESKAYEAHEKPFKQAQYEGNAGETDKPAEMTMAKHTTDVGVGAMKQGAGGKMHGLAGNTGVNDPEHGGMGKMHGSPSMHMAEHHRHMAEYHKHMAYGAGDIGGGDSIGVGGAAGTAGAAAGQ